MHKITIPEANLSIDFPQNIHELSPTQYHYYVQLVLMISKAHLNLDEFKTLLVYHFMNMTYSGKQSDDKLLQLSALIELLEDFFESKKSDKGNVTVTPITGSPSNRAQQFKFKKIKYHGPADALADITLTQFVQGLSLSNSFSKEPEKHYLVQLFALFHTFSNGLTKKRYPVTLDKASKLEDYHLYGFYFFFNAAIEFITTQDIHLADGRVYNFSPLFQSGESSSSIGPVSVLFDLAENGVFGDIEKTGHTNLMQALIYLLKSHLDAKKLKKK